LRDSDEKELRQLFRGLREEEEGRAPDFRAIMARAREEASSEGEEIGPWTGEAPQPGRRETPRRRRRLAWGGGLLAAAAAAAILLLGRGPEVSDADFVRAVQALSDDPAMGAWTSPTDVLLRLPGDKILSTLPSIHPGRWPMDPRPRSSGNETVRSHS